MWGVLLNDMIETHGGISSTLGKPKEVYRLLGLSLTDFLSFVRNDVVGGSEMSREVLIDAWRDANDHYAELEEAEAGLADDHQTEPLSEDCAALIETAMADPRYIEANDEFPTEFRMIELDRLICFQHYVTRTFSEAQQASVGPNSTAPELLEFCLPSERADPPVKIDRLGSKYVFSSESTDLRRHRPVLVEPSRISDYTGYGPLAGLVGLGVGFGSNYFTAIKYEGRIMLHNGYHRAHSMRAAGITHAPCIVRTVRRVEELKLAVKEEVADDLRFYFKAARPPLLKDFFDPKICKSYAVHKKKKVVEVSYEINEYFVRI